MRVLRWKNVVAPGEQFHFARQLYRRGSPIILHRHDDFAEVFWIEEGRGLHRLNGRLEEIGRGDLVFIRPRDTHEFQGLRGGLSFSLANFAVPDEAAGFWSRHWRGLGVQPAPWSEPGEPVRFRLEAGQLAAIGQAARDIASDTTQAPARDRFLATLLHELRRSAEDEPPLPAGAPDWLSRAVAELHAPNRPEISLDFFFRTAGRSREHVARICRRWTGATPTGLINQVRLHHARRLLQRTGLSVLEVAEASGFRNLSLFHRLFRAATGTTPARYRAGLRRSLPQA